MEVKCGPIRILQIVPNMQAGGIETWLMNIYRTLDPSKIQFDFLVHYSQRFFYDDEIEQLGGRIYRLTVRNDSNIIKYVKDLYVFFKNHKEYKVIHSHMPSLAFLFLGMARIHHVPVRISHSHNSDFNKNWKGYFGHLLSRLAKINATDLFSCSMLAGEYLYGKSSFNIMHLAINIDKYSFNEDLRTKVRKELNIKDEFVIGHVGRFNYQKNHAFVLKILAGVLKVQPQSKLMLVGNGELATEIKQEVINMHMEDKVLFLGERNDLDKLYQAMDVFILPSFFEGLPVVGIEAQAAGLKSLVADTITKELQITETIEYLRIDKGVDSWVDSISKTKINYNRKCSYVKLTQAGYNIQQESKLIMNVYQQLYIRTYM